MLARLDSARLGSVLGWVPGLTWVAAVGCPLVGEDRHHRGVYAFAVPAQRMAQHAFGDEADLLVDASGARIERIDLE